MEKPMVTPCFFFRGAQRRDKDNLLAMLKSAFDGLTDAQVWADDSKATYLPVEITTGVPVAQQKVVLLISEGVWHGDV